MIQDSTIHRNAILMGGIAQNLMRDFQVVMSNFQPGLVTVNAMESNTIQPSVALMVAIVLLAHHLA